MAAKRRPGAPPPDGARGIAAIGPGAAKRRGGSFLAEEAKARKSPRPTYRFGFCAGRADCPGHAFIRDGEDTGEGCE